MPMGQKNAPSFFQRVMEHLLFNAHPELLAFVSMYIDDIMIAAEGQRLTEEELVALHEKQLNQVTDIQLIFRAEEGRRERTESRAAGGRQNKQNRAPRPRAPWAGNQRKPETTGAHEGRKRNESKAPSGNNKGETQTGGGWATAREQPTARQHQRRESTRRAKKREANKTNNAQRQGPGHRGPETKESKRQSGRKEDNNGETKKKSKSGREGRTKDQDWGNPSPEGAKESRKTKRPREKVRRTRTRPGGRPARLGRGEQAHAHTHGTWA